ncbi:MAG: PDZ domain-containing protein [Ignavibacteria bacterium]|nr:PDZ domain-containing protein [Ignavibacteria bacterium]
MFWYVLAIIFMFVSISDNILAEEARLLRFPNPSKDYITFVYAGDIYIVRKEGGVARRLTTSEGIELFPRFSPDGKWIAFSAEYDGNRDVYLMPATGGEPKRLTYSMDLQNVPERMGPDKIIMGWSNDGKKILYRSRSNWWHSWSGKLFYVSVEGGLPEELPLPRAGFASLSPDGKKLAYNRVFREFRTWKRYRGGQADDIWIYDFETKKIENITNNPAQDIIPMWYKDKIYFLSDRDHTMNLFCYDLRTKQTKKITNFDKYDVKFPSIGGDFIAFENGGYIYLLDPQTDKYEKVRIEISEDFPSIRPRFKNVKEQIQSFDISPDGAKGLFSSRGEVFTVPAEKGLIKNITNTPAIHDRAPVWSPDGKWIAYISDKSGETEVYISKPDGTGEIQLTNNAKTYRYFLKWSPDSKKLLCTDKLMELYVIDIETRKITPIRKSKVWEITDFAWSPDSRWIAFVDYLETRFSVIYIYSLETKEIRQVTSEFFSSYAPEFSSDGKYLFFASDRTFKATVGAFEWNFQYRDVSKIYGITLQKATMSPFALDEDEKSKKEEKPVEESKDKIVKSKSQTTDVVEKGKVNVAIDFDGIIDRIFDFPVPNGEYRELRSVGNKLYYVRSSTSQSPKLYVFDIETKKESEVGDFHQFEISFDGKKIIFKKDNDYYITDLKEKVSTEKGKLDLKEMTVYVNPTEEWKQIFEESWRQMRDFFYDPNLHGVDWKAMKAKYEELLPFCRHRFDLTYIIGEMIGELNAGHAYVGGGDMPKVEPVAIGLLGAEYEFDAKTGFYKIKKIFKGRNWEEKTRSPLLEPGLNIKEGDYLIEIDGVRLSKEITPYRALLNKSNKYVTIKVNSFPSLEGAKEYKVKTIESEAGLRYLDWVEYNRNYVEKKTNGKIGYIHIPDMGIDNGLNEFVKYFYPQVRKEGLVIDDRYNGGGNVSPMIIERLRRILLIARNARNQEAVLTNPDAVMTGPMVCLVNELSASDGDLFPYQFKKLGLGKVVGKRTWGGVIGIRGSLPFLDGGYLMKPEFSNFAAEGIRILEGEGLTPDIEIDNDPALEYEGIDQQLDKAIEIILEELKTDTKPKVPKIPPFPIKR